MCLDQRGNQFGSIQSTSKDPNLQESLAQFRCQPLNLSPALLCVKDHSLDLIFAKIELWLSVLLYRKWASVITEPGAQQEWLRLLQILQTATFKTFSLSDSQLPSNTCCGPVTFYSSRNSCHHCWFPTSEPKKGNVGVVFTVLDARTFQIVLQSLSAFLEQLLSL